MKSIFAKVKGAKLAVMVAAISLVMCTVIGGTVAWLVDKTAPVTNTFTYGDISIDLTETTGSNYKMMPGNTISKDPRVTVKAKSEACWLFVDIDKSEHFDKFMTYGVAQGWTQLTEDAEGKDITADLIFYRTVEATGDNPIDFNVLEGNTVTVKNEVTKKDFEDYAKDNFPTLTFTAYAVQRDAVVTSAAQAWSLTK